MLGSEGPILWVVVGTHADMRLGGREQGVHRTYPKAGAGTGQD